MTSPYATGVVGEFGLSGNSKIDPLLVIGFKWGSGGAGTSAAISYSFPTNASLWHSDYATYLESEPFINFQAFDFAQQQAAERALDLWDDVANITFSKIDETVDPMNVGDIRFGNSGAVTNSPSAAWAYLPYDDFPYEGFVYPENGDVWFDYAYQPNLELDPGEFGFSTMLHEIGHAIGLDHPFADEPGELALPAAQNNQRYTIMAYNLYSGATIEAYGPMLYDILALQYIYGANMTTRAGDDVYTFQTDKEYLEAIWDAGGHDTIDLSNQTRNQVIDLRAGTFSSIGVKNNGQTGNGNVAIAFNVTIEDAVGGSGHDKITGNDVANDLDGKAGNDTIVGGLGNDTLTGGTGNDSMSGGKDDDLYFVDSTLDKVIELAGEGSDTVKSTVSYSFAAVANVENLELVGAGNLNGTGNASNNTILGNGGNNILDGGLGNDTLTGGAGNDTYILNAVGDMVIELGSDTGDTVKSSAASLAAFAGIENYFFTGASAFKFSGDGVANVVSGGSGNDTMDGAGGNDTLLGNGGNDSLIGGTGDDLLDGGLGNDKMNGGSGNDTYVINAAGDTITEEGGDTEDLVKSSVTVNLAILASGLIEHTILTGATAINATGNGEDNELTGNNAANKLDGGAGADFLDGGKGSDIYTVDNVGDKIVETTGGAAGGVDVVNSSIDFTLGANVEKLTLLASFGDIDGTGNSLNNTILGNEGANRLDGGVGNDTMTGGKGSDTYVVDSAKDVVNETIANNKGGGIDTVESAVTFSLATRVNIENLTLTGTGDINGTGNALANTILGTSGNNILDGGAGADVLKGGAGNDTYVFDSLADTATEDAASGTDELKTKAKIAAGLANIENYTYTGTGAWSFTGTGDDNKISGAAGNDTLTGGDGKDTLLGNGGNDSLIGDGGDDWLDGGLGNDKMAGGAGNDTYVIGALADFIDEQGADKGDTVRSTLTVNLATLAGGAIEHAVLLGTAKINAIGNNADNLLTGNDGANVLNGGWGADTMSGGKGSDVYYINEFYDKVVETVGGAAGGIDLVYSEITHILGDNFENLTLIGDYNGEAWGNSLNNVLIGNDGGNKLHGLGGADTMMGGKGSDFYYVETASDVVKETVANDNDGGSDTVQSDITFSLASHVYIENLRLAGLEAINGTGNELNNALFGNYAANVLKSAGGNDAVIGDGGADTIDGGSGNDTLEGGEGADLISAGLGDDYIYGDVGQDTLTGGGGNDLFVFADLDDLGDIITDFTKGADKISILPLLFSSEVDYKGNDVFGDGLLSFSYNGANTNILFDADGNSGIGSGPTLLATLQNATLTSSDLDSFIVTA